MLNTHKQNAQKLAGLPADMGYTNLEAKIVETFSNNGCGIDSEKINVGHNVNKKICMFEFKFGWRKDWHKVPRKKVYKRK